MTVGQDDGGQGEFTPAYGIVYRDLQNCIIKDNVLHQGALQQLVVDLGNNTEETTIIKDNIGRLMQLER